MDGKDANATHLLHLLLNSIIDWKLSASRKVDKNAQTFLHRYKVLLLFVSKTGNLVEKSADEESWSWLKILKECEYFRIISVFDGQEIYLLC